MDEALEQYEQPTTELAAKSGSLAATSPEVSLGMKSGCTAYVSSTMQVFSFKQLENALGISGSKPFTIRDGTNNHYAFMGTICRGGFDLYTEANKKTDRVKLATDKGEESKEGKGYKKSTKKWTIFKKPYAVVGHNSDGTSSSAINTYTSKYIMHKAKFRAYLPDQTNGRYGGYQILFQSHETNNGKPVFDVTMNIKCKAEDAGKTITWKKNAMSGTSWTLETESKYGCQVMDLKFMQSMKMFAGAFEILFGIALCFFGAKFINYAFQFLAFLLIFGGVMGLGNVVLDFYSSKTALFATLAVAVITAGLLSYFFKAVFINYGTFILGGAGGVMIGVMVTSPF